MLSGEIYFPDIDEVLKHERLACKALCYDFNHLHPAKVQEREILIRKIFGKTCKRFLIEQPFICDYGYNVEIGENFYSNHNLTILDCAKVKFGDNVFIGPNCSFYTAIHPLDAETRNKGAETALPITIGNNVWFGGNVVVLPNVTIGNNCVIGAGSVVTKNIPDNSLAFGNPCRVVREI
ncbi:sugar O-acetyltransferase [bacterium]|nr:sugar O-acetyltransferase [bacterium]